MGVMVGVGVTVGRGVLVGKMGVMLGVREGPNVAIAAIRASGACGGCGVQVGGKALSARVGMTAATALVGTAVSCWQAVDKKMMEHSRRNIIRFCQVVSPIWGDHTIP